MSTRFEAWADRPVTRDGEGKFARGGGVDAFVQRVSDHIGQSRGEPEPEPDNDYRMQHQPPDRDYGASMNDPEVMMPDLLAHPEYYNMGMDRTVISESMAAIRKAVRGGPGAMIRIYRAVPNIAQDIHPGNWVTPSRAYAQEHIGDMKGWKILERDVRAGDLFFEGNSVAEWGWVPE